MALHGLLSQQPAAVPAPGAAPAGLAAPGAAPPGAPAGGIPAPHQVGGEEQPNVTPEEQQAYDAFVNNALTVISDEKSLPSIVQSLKGDGNPVDGLANTAVAVVVWVQDSAEQAGQALAPDVVFQAGNWHDLGALKKQVRNLITVKRNGLLRTAVRTVEERKKGLK